MGSFVLELRYAFRERVVVTTLAFAFLLAVSATVAGKLEIYEQLAEIDRLSTETSDDQGHVLKQQPDVGSAAYYTYHVTYQPPTKLAFSALGTREELPWQHRVRMLALEGQIYESDTGNPELSGLGRLDFAFLAAVLLPLALILLLYDLDAGERRAGRYELLTATSANGDNTLLIKAAARGLLLFVFTTLPFAVTVVLSSAPATQSMAMLLVVFLHLVFWLAICRYVTTRCAEAPTAATVLLACWLVFTTVIPAAARIIVESSTPVPLGGEILLAQREAVNGAWDLPKPATMDPFMAAHPQWQAGATVTQPFEWKWYYAFQQQGDEHVKASSQALREGIARRDTLMGRAALLSPPLATERWLTHIAGTDRAHHQDYLACVRAFHVQLREFHYPMLFGQTDYTPEAMSGLPSFEYCKS